MTEIREMGRNKIDFYEVYLETCVDGEYSESCSYRASVRYTRQILAQGNTFSEMLKQLLEEDSHKENE